MVQINAIEKDDWRSVVFETPDLNRRSADFGKVQSKSRACEKEILSTLRGLAGAPADSESVRSVHRALSTC